MAEHYDVIICGGGPVGLMLAYQLVRLGISILAIEQFDKPQQDMYGRASTLSPRTSELLDQLDLLDEMAQVGLIGRASVTYKDGQRIQDRGWDHLHTLSDTYLTYNLNIRQKYSENIFRTALERYGGTVNAGWILRNFVLDDDADDYKVSAEITDQRGMTVTAKSKYIIGADGGKSSVRKIAGIPFIGEKSAFQWVRIDAVIKTDMPQSRVGFGAIESATHGNNVLWVSLDHGRSRIGFALPKALQDQYGENITEEIVKQEAAKAMAPFKIEFVSVDWWTYSPERRAVAQYLINLDKTMSTLISGNIPESYTGNVHGGDTNLILLDVVNSAKHFTTGLGIAYEPDNFLNKAAGFTSVRTGRRAPDVLVRKPGSSFPTRLYELTKNNGKFWVVVFAGEPIRTAANLKALRAYLDSVDSFTKRLTDAFNFLTIIAGTGSQPDEILGVEKFGRAYYDTDHAAYTRYAISTAEGAIVVLRPDGILAFAAGLDQGADIGTYFDAIVPLGLTSGRDAHNGSKQGGRLKSHL